MFRNTLLWICAALVCAFALTSMASSTSGQTLGTVTGLVTDSSGAAVEGANVTLTDTATHTTRATTSNAVGRYIFPDVTPSTYNITVTKSGFQTTVATSQTVLVGTQLTVNLVLKLGSISTTVEVKQVAGAQLQTQNATVGTTVSGDMLLDLPSQNRDATALLTLQPATAPSVGGGDIYGGQVAGSLSDQNTYMLDGGNITSDLEGDNNYTSGGQGAIPTPVESIQEFKVATNNQTADFASSAGGQVMLQTKRGTDQFHGAAYYFLRSSVFDADNWFDKYHTYLDRLSDPTAKGVPQVKFHDNRFGGGVGGPMLPGQHLGGRTYFYAFYEGRRYPTAANEEWTVPSMLLRQGIVQYRDANDVVHQVDLATSTVCGGGACDPRGVGISPIVSQMWNKFMPQPNDLGFGDTLNTQGFIAPISLPLKDDYGTGRIDHNFGQNWQLFLSYRVFREIAPSTNQIDIGGLLSGDKLGVPAAVSSNPRHPAYYVAGLTGTITPNVVNEFHIGYLLNSWSWQRQGVTDALSGVPAGIEFSDSHYGCMCPVNMDTQDARNRVWDGHDWTYSDTLNWNKGEHFMQFGGSFVHWWDHHVRDDQVVAGLPELVYQLNKGTGLVMSSTYRPTDLPSSQNSSWDSVYAQTLGFVGTAAQLFVRGGSDFHLTGAKTFSDTSITDTYNLFFNDSWHVKPTLTINYGLEWGTQMPPYEINGVQDYVVDQYGVPITTQQYLQNTVAYALKGQVYNPNLGFEPIRAVAGHPKYPFAPFYGGFSPRIAVAWNPRFDSGMFGRVFGNGKTVFRAGYARIYDRNNAVDLVLTPLLGYGFGQTIRCNGAGIKSGSAGCYGSSSTDPTNGFRLGVDGTTAPFPAVTQTLPIPAVPGINSPAGGNLSFLDSNWRPGSDDEVSVGIQRELPGQMLLEVDYVGKWSNHLFEGLDLNNVPWMMTLNGQSFAQAYANLWKADQAGATTVAAQPFFEAALAGSPYCSTAPTCSDAVLAGEGAAGTANITNENVYGLWSDLDTTWTAFGPALPATTQGYNSMIGNGTPGFSNYQGGIIRVQKNAGHGLMFNANFTMSKTLSTVGINQEYTQANPSVPFDLRYDYVPAPFDTRFVFNLLGTYELPFGKGQRFANNSRILDLLIGGISISPIFQANSGLVQETYTGSCDEFGQGNTPFCSGAVLTAPASSFSRSIHRGVDTGGSNIGSDGNVSNGGTGINLFADPAAAYANMRPVILGVDTRANDLGPLYGQHRWNLDFDVTKTERFTESIGATFYAEFFNGLNHMEFSDPGQYGSGGLNLQNPGAFGVISSQYNSPRNIELGMRLFF